MNTKAIQTLNNLINETVRITVETVELDNGYIIFERYNPSHFLDEDRYIKRQVMYIDGMNTISKTNQKLIKILKIERYKQCWVNVDF